MIEEIARQSFEPVIIDEVQDINPNIVLKRLLLATPVDSTAIEDYNYETGDKVLTVTFKSGAIYSYADVPRSLFTQFKHSTSRGRFFMEHIRDKFPTAKLEDAKKGGPGSGNFDHRGLPNVHGGSRPEDDTSTDSAKDEIRKALGFDLTDDPATPPWRRSVKPKKPSQRREWWAAPTTKLDDDAVGWVNPNRAWKYHAINREEEDELSNRNPESGKRYLDELERDVVRYGFLEPALFDYNPRRHVGSFGEGNHRLAVARRLDLELPVVGLRHDGMGPLPGIPLPGTAAETFKDLQDHTGRRFADDHFHFPKEFNPEPLFK